MQMKGSEIASKYKRSDNKKDQLQILADLNGCDTDCIRQILREEGIPEHEIWKPRKRRTKEEMMADKGKEVVDTTVQQILEEPNLTPEEQTQLDRALAIPIAVRDACIEKMDVLTSKIMELEKQRDQISDFLEGREND